MLSPVQWCAYPASWRGYQGKKLVTSFDLSERGESFRTARAAVLAGSFTAGTVEEKPAPAHNPHAAILTTSPCSRRPSRKLGLSSQTYSSHAWRSNSMRAWKSAAIRWG